jgi:hypothetical protein
MLTNLQCGTINSLKLLPPENDSVAAVIEFDTKDDAAAALTRDQKQLGGRTIDVQIGSGSTLFVTNFPPTADEEYIINLFQEVCSRPRKLVSHNKC